MSCFFKILFDKSSANPQDILLRKQIRHCICDFLRHFILLLCCGLPAACVRRACALPAACLLLLPAAAATPDHCWILVPHCISQENTTKWFWLINKRIQASATGNRWVDTIRDFLGVVHDLNNHRANYRFCCGKTRGPYVPVSKLCLWDLLPRICLSCQKHHCAQCLGHFQLNLQVQIGAKLALYQQDSNLRKGCPNQLFPSRCICILRKHEPFQQRICNFSYCAQQPLLCIYPIMNEIGRAMRFFSLLSLSISWYDLFTSSLWHDFSFLMCLTYGEF